MFNLHTLFNKTSFSISNYINIHLINRIAVSEILHLKTLFLGIRTNGVKKKPLWRRSVKQF